MSISNLLSSYESNLKSIDDRLIDFTLSVTAIDIINDPKLKLVTKPKTTDDDLRKLSLSQLNNKINEIKVSLDYLDRLWYINGYIKEVQCFLNNDQQAYDKLELELILSNLIKLNESINKFNDSLIIKNDLIGLLDQLVDKFVKLLNSIFLMFLPNEFVFNKNLKNNNLDYFEFIEIINNFETDFNKNSIIKSWFHEKQLQWDAILNKLAKSLNYLELQQEDDSYTIKLKPFTKFDEEYFKSISSFIYFINLFNSQPIKNFYNSKISNNLASKISENINYLINNSNGNNDNSIHELINLIELSKSTNWNLLSSLTSTETIEEKLNNLYLDWIVDKYIHKIREFFNTEFKSLVNDLQDEPTEKETEDDWNRGWNDNDDEDEDEDDGWDNEIELSDNENNKWNWDTNSEKSNKTSVKISKVPAKLISILNDYNKKSNKYQVNYLISVIKSLSLISYPPLSKSFVFLNDFNYLSTRLNLMELSMFSQINWNQTLIKLTSEIKGILLSINLKHDDFIDNLDEYELDDDNLNKLSLIYQAFNKSIDSDLSFTNFEKFKSLVITNIELINNWLIQSIIGMDEITEFQSLKFTKLIDQLNNITIPILFNINESKNSIKSFNKLNNLVFLINNHLKDIMDRFYQGELFDFETDELISVIKSIFIKSELRDGYIDEIIEARISS